MGCGGSKEEAKPAGKSKILSEPFDLNGMKI